MVDRVFTRIGASDNLARGRSTFMVEMTETAAILHTATARSLILLDEVGRGTSTYDGLAIAWAAVEYLHARVRAKTLFATHYFELTELAEQLAGVKNYHVSVKETGGGIVFCERWSPGRQIAVMELKSPSWRDCRMKWSSGRARCWRSMSSRSSRRPRICRRGRRLRRRS